MVIQQWSLPWVQSFALSLPEGWRFLSLERNPANSTEAWLIILCDPKNPVTPVQFQTFGSGAEVPTGYEYLGTVPMGSMFFPNHYFYMKALA